VLRQLMKQGLRPDGVWMGSSSWLVSAWKNGRTTRLLDLPFDA
jgi:hypothetical protein